MMREEQRKHFEERLLRERERAVKALAQFDERARIPAQEDDGELTSYPVHPADEGSDTIEQEQQFLLASKEGRLVYWIDDALRTLYRTPETYGKCIDCEEPIAYERLDIVPWAKMCIECQRTEEDRTAEAA